jgi:hypothetical protein
MKHTTTSSRDRPERPSGARGPVARRRIRLAGDATSLCDARHLVAETLREGPSELRYVAMLLTGELVTNAILHGGGRFLLEVDTAPDRLRVEVTDSSAVEPRLLRMTSDREHGRGMAIVDALATRWGSDHLEDHKVVWFEIRLGP